MELKIDSAQLFIPDGKPEDVALSRTTHMGIGAHQDDLEIMAIDGILKCFQREDLWFTGVTVTNGRGSSRTGLYEKYTDDEMQTVRAKEQIKAAFIGEYAAQFLLDFPSSAVKNANNDEVVEELITIFNATKPQVVYTHNLADKHTTHIGVTSKVLKALRSLPEEDRPKHVYGCEVWRDLDWMVADDKVAFDTTQQEGVQNALVGVFDSQITGGKRYDLATMGRRRAHATYHEAHFSDDAAGLVFAMNLTPLVKDPSLDIAEYSLAHVQRFYDDVKERLASVNA